MLNQNILKNLLYYNPDNGIFTWKNTLSNRVKIGDIAGTKMQSGEIVIGIDGKRYFAHRLAWFYIHGTWPKKLIDHINTIRSDNRIVNLREATKSENGQNRKKSNSNNPNNLLGVSRHYKKYAAKITINRNLIHLGTFDTPELAHQAYLEAKRQLHSHNTL
jgi:hypothetical protein